MPRQNLTLFLLLITSFVYGQNKSVTSEILTPQETSNLFTDSLHNQLAINFPIRRVYECEDKSGKFFIVLTESNDSITPDQDTLHYRIKAFNFRQENNGLLKKWEMNDAITKPPDSDEMENSIWFWTKYCKFEDLDNDNLIDPILIYGTSAMNYIDDGRIKILIYFKGKKYAIRHQNSILDHGRNTQVDKSFYQLPLKIQEHIKLIMKKMMDDGNAIFPHGWQSAMKARKLFFDENN